MLLETFLICLQPFPIVLSQLKFPGARQFLLGQLDARYQPVALTPELSVAIEAFEQSRQSDAIVRVDSEAPTTTLIVEPSLIARRLPPNPGVDAKLLDTAFYLQFEGDCGWAFCDAGHLTDDCWVVF